MLTVLMIDDDEDVIATVQEHLTEAVPGITFLSESNFADALAAIHAAKPDVVILDWFRGNPATGEPVGDAVWTEIWKQWFCPIVVYSAGDVDFTDAPPSDHPFVRVISKGASTEEAIAEQIRAYAPHVESVRDVAQDLSRVTHSVLRHLAPILFSAVDDPQQRSDALKRAARRRAAAMFDDASCYGAEVAHAWEQYIFPVLTDHPLVGDLLRERSKDVADTTAYRIVLTPTCDMVLRNGRCKVSRVLVARSEDPTSFIRNGIVPVPSKAADLKQRLKSALNEAHQAGIAILPECPGLAPLVAINLRELELVAVSDIGLQENTDKEFIRVASIDSPFREYVIWGYMQIGCRPGLPPRDTRTVVDALCDRWKAQATDGK